MKRNAFLTLFPVVLVLSAGMAFANQFSDDVVAQLSRQGFTTITRNSTWLGRVQIQAERKDGHREIVLNPRTGEILRDEWTTKKGAVVTRPILDDRATAATASGTTDAPDTSVDSDESGTSDASGSDSGGTSGSDDSKSDSGSGTGHDAGSDNSSGSGGGSDGDHEKSDGGGTDN
ncbi:MAG: hypothetical protein ACOH2H_14745 [Cypionkella sp.]